MANRPNCPACGASVSPEARYCDHCGTPLQLSLTPARRSSVSGRIAVWAFVLIVSALYAGGAVGGFRYKADRWPFQPAARLTMADPQQPEVTIPPPAPRRITDSSTTDSLLKSVVSIHVKGEQEITTGSGFIIGTQGHVVTVAHVVGDRGQCVQVIDDNGKTHTGRILRRDANLDIAVVEVPTLRGWAFRLELGKSASLNITDPVYVMSSARGTGGTTLMPAEFSRTVQGIRINERYFQELLQVTGATVVHGSSGGPLIDSSSGQVVGIVTAGTGAQLAYALPIDLVAGTLKTWAALPSEGACGAPAAARTESLLLATITPLSGRLGVLGTDLADGAELALRDMENELRRVGYEVTLKRYDDQSAPLTAAEQALAAEFDPQVIGVVGSLDSATTHSVAATLKVGRLVVVAPTAGADELTAQGWQHFNRIVASSRRHEQVAARFLRERLRAGNVFLLDDGWPDSIARVRAFEAAAQVLSLQVKGRARVTPSTDYAELRQQLTDTRAEAVFYAGGPETALQVVKGLRQAGSILPIIGGESLYTNAFGTLADEVSRGVYFTLLTTGPSDRFQRHFESVFGKPARGLAAYGYDSARLILEALVLYGEANPATKPSRAELAQLVRNTKGYPGRAANVTFDEVGDNRTSRVFIYEWTQRRAELREVME